MGESKPSLKKRQPYDQVPYNPARKPRKLQWAIPSPNGYFICGRCKSLYRTRIRLHFHKKEKCYNEICLEDQTFKQILEKCS